MVTLMAILRDKGALLDGTRRIVLDCNEATPEQLLEVLRHNNTPGWFAFKALPVQDRDIPEVEGEFKGDKSPGQRLRGVIWAVWNQSTGKKKTFEEFYRSQMEGIIQQYKEKYLI